MIGDDLKCLDLTGCDIPEPENHKDCKVVIDVHTGRLVALQPDDEIKNQKQAATEEWLLNCLTRMNRRTLYSRVITTTEIKLGDIHQLIMRIKDRAEELMDHILLADDFEPDDEPIDVMLTRSRFKRKCCRTLVKKAIDGRDVVNKYILMRSFDEKQVATMWPFIKSRIHQCMMLQDDFPYCDLEKRYLECIEILMGPSPWNDPCSVQMRAACVTEITLLRKIWQEERIAGCWDQIKELPKMPVEAQGYKYKKMLIYAETMLAEKKELISTISNLSEQIVMVQKEKEKVRVQVEETTEATGDLMGTMVVVELSENAGDQAEASKIKRQKGSICLETSPPQSQEPAVCPCRHQTMNKQGKTRRVQATDQYRAMSELPAATALLAGSDLVSSNTDASVLAESEGAISEEAKSYSLKLAANVAHTVGSARQPTLITRPVKICKGEHGDGEETKEVDEGASLSGTTRLSDTDGSVLSGTRGTIFGQGAIPKKARLPSANPTASVLHTGEITDDKSFMKRLTEKCEMLHNDYIMRKYQVYSYLVSPTDENRKTALEAISGGFWCSRHLCLILRDIVKTSSTGSDDPFVRKYNQLVRNNAFECGVLPLFGETEKKHCFTLVRGNGTDFSLVLSQGCLPSEAIRACREQLFVSSLSCFFQTIIYDVVSEVLGDVVFNWYYSCHDSRLRLTNNRLIDSVFSPLKRLFSQIGSRKPVDGCSKSGVIKEWSNIACCKDDFIDKCNTLYAVCVNEKDQLYVAPCIDRITKELREESNDDGSRSSYWCLVGEPGSLDDVDMGEVNKYFGCNERYMVIPERKIAICELTYRCEWNQVMKIKISHKKYIQEQQLKHDEFMHEFHKKEEKQRHRRRTKVESSLAGVSEQQPSLTMAPEQSLPKAPQVLTSVSLYQDKPTDYEAGVNKAKSQLTSAVRAFKSKNTDENKKHLEFAITALEECTKDLDVTGEIDDDTRRMLQKQTSAALKQARKIKD